MPKLSTPPPVEFASKPGKATRIEHIEAAEMARANPGQSVELDGTWPSNLVATIKSTPGALNGQGQIQTPPPYRDGLWDATQRAANDGTKKVRIWVTFLGDEGSPNRVLALVQRKQRLEAELEEVEAGLKEATLAVAKTSKRSQAELADLARIDKATLKQWLAE